MYINKNKAISFLEIIIVSSISLILITISLTYFSLLNKNFSNWIAHYQRERQILTCRELMWSYIDWNESKDFRILNISKTKTPKGLRKVFTTKGNVEGNFLIIKIESYDSQDHLCNYYKCFLFSDNNLIMSYYKDENIHELPYIFNDPILIDNCSGKFILSDDNLIFHLEDNKKGKIYEEILF